VDVNIHREGDLKRGKRRAWSVKDEGRDEERKC